MFDQLRYHRRLLVLFVLLFVCVLVLLQLIDESTTSTDRIKCNNNIVECGHQRSLHTRTVRLLTEPTIPDDIDLSSRLVHIDLKGAPPRLAYLFALFPLLHRWNVSGILIEYEDMFPYTGRLSALCNSAGTYSSDDIISIQHEAHRNNLIVIPLVQTFGHLEYVLKHAPFVSLRELVTSPEVICPSDDESFVLLTEMLTQVRRAHSQSTMFHIGADEAYHIGKDRRCIDAMNRQFANSTDRLVLAHLSRMAAYMRNTLNVTRVLIWNDMFSQVSVELLHEYRLGALVEPVVWGYAEDVTAVDYFPTGMFDRYSQIFPRIWFGSAFKGANGKSTQYINVNRYLNNHESYMRLIDANINQLRNRTTGFILTGWQRFQHFEVLCELLPVAIPSLLANLLFLNRRTLVRAPDLIDQVRRTLNCSSSSSGVFDDVNYAIPQSAMHFMNCTFPGAQVFDDIEMIRYRKWKIKRHLNDAIMTDQMIVELRRLIDDLRHHMNQIYFANTIDEWIQTNVYAFIDDIEMRRRNSVND